MSSRLLLSLVAVTALAGPLCPLSAQQPSHAAASPEIETVGTGERRITPDRATILLQIESRGAAAANAATLNSAAVQAVRNALRRANVDSAAATASYHVGPEYGPPVPVARDEGPRVIGYIARTVLRARVTRLDQLGSAIDAALAAGATGVEGIFFESSTADEARRSALADAAAAARRDAEVLARAMGGSLGRLLGTSTAGAGDPRRFAMGMRDGFAFGGSAATQITPTEIVITAGVVGRWQFIEAR